METKYLLHASYYCKYVTEGIDNWQKAGQALLRPLSLMAGRSCTVTGPNINGLESSSCTPTNNPWTTTNKVIAVLGCIFFPLTLLAAPIGAALLSKSKTLDAHHAHLQRYFPLNPPVLDPTFYDYASFLRRRSAIPAESQPTGLK